MEPVSLNGALQSGASGFTDVRIFRQQTSVSQSAGASQGQGSSPLTPNNSLTQTQTMMSVQSRVDQFLASFGQAMPSDQQLRLIIALLVLNALLGGENTTNSANNRASELLGLRSALEVLDRRGQAPMFSATNIIQIQHQSTLVYSEQAIQSMSGASGDPSSSNADAQRLDVTA